MPAPALYIEMDPRARVQCLTVLADPFDLLDWIFEQDVHLLGHLEIADYV